MEASIDSPPAPSFYRSLLAAAPKAHLPILLSTDTSSRVSAILVEFFVKEEKLKCLTFKSGVGKPTCQGYERLIVTPWPLCFYSITWGFLRCTFWKKKQFGVSIDFGWPSGQNFWNPAMERHCSEMKQKCLKRATAEVVCSHQSPVNRSWSRTVQESRDGVTGCTFLKGRFFFFPRDELL